MNKVAHIVNKRFVNPGIYRMFGNAQKRQEYRIK